MFEARTGMFLRRFGAGVIDVCFVGILFVCALLAPLWFYGSMLIEITVGLFVGAGLLWFANGVLFPAFVGQTLGDRACGIKTVSLQIFRSRGIGFSSALIRGVTQYGLSSFFLLGYIWYFVDDCTHRMWHDFASGTMMIRTNEPVPASREKRALVREIGLFILGLFGIGFLLIPIAALLGFNIFVLTLKDSVLARQPASVSSALHMVVLKDLPADFPSKIIIPVKENITLITREDLQDGVTTDVAIRWEKLPAEPVEAMVAYKNGYELLGFTTDMRYTDTGPVLHFVDAADHADGTITLVPSKDIKTIDVLLMKVRYLRKK